MPPNPCVWAVLKVGLRLAVAPYVFLLVVFSRRAGFRATVTLACAGMVHWVSLFGSSVSHFESPRLGARTVLKAWLKLAVVCCPLFPDAVLSRGLGWFGIGWCCIAAWVSRFLARWCRDLGPGGHSHGLAPARRSRLRLCGLVAVSPRRRSLRNLIDDFGCYFVSIGCRSLCVVSAGSACCPGHLHGPAPALPSAVSVILPPSGLVINFRHGCFKLVATIVLLRQFRWFVVVVL